MLGTCQRYLSILPAHWVPVYINCLLTAVPLDKDLSLTHSHTDHEDGGHGQHVTGPQAVVLHVQLPAGHVTQEVRHRDDPEARALFQVQLPPAVIVGRVRLRD